MYAVARRFIFDIVHTVGTYQGRRGVLRRRLVDHMLSLIGGGIAVYGVYRAILVPTMENLRMSPRFF